jgi:hypothetical protein
MSAMRPGSPSGPPGGAPPVATGAGSGMTPAERAAREVEAQIRNNPHESAYAFDPGGNLVLSKTGNQSEIRFSAAEVGRIGNCVLTHNHPAGLAFPRADPRSESNSFSLSDLRLATLGQVAEMRVVTPVWRFSMRAPSRGWDAVYFSSILEPAFKKHEQAMIRDLARALLYSTFSPEAYQAHYYHEIWTRVAAELGLQYRQEP